MKFSPSINLLLGSLASVVLTSAASASLIAHWDFDSGLSDVSGNGHTASLAGGGNAPTAVVDRFGNPTGAYSFDGNDHISTAGWGGGLPTTTVTYSAWATSDVSNNGMLFVAGVDNRGPDLWFTGGQFYWNTWDGSANPFTDPPTHFGAQPADVTDGNWHHYVVSQDLNTGTAQLYYDGQLYGTANDSQWGGNHNTAFSIGSSNASGSWGFSGDIDDVQIYDTALSAAEVASLYNTGAVGVPDGGNLLVLLGGALFGLIFISKKRIRR